MSDQVVAFVHAKGESDRVPGKNRRTLGDRPLFCHAIANARRAPGVDRVVIDSDDDAILEIGAAHGATVLRRPKELATNLATGDDLAYWQASNYPESRIVLQVIPTAPFLTPETIGKAIAMLEKDGVDSVVGVFADVFYRWENGRPAYYRADGTIPNSCDMKPIIYETTGLYVNRTAAVLASRKRMNPESAQPIFVSRLESVDINTPEDFEFATLLWRGMQGAA